MACQITKNKATFRQIPLSKEYGIFKFGDSIGTHGMQRGGRSESGGKSFQTVVEQHKLFSEGKEEVFNNIENIAETKSQENTDSIQERVLNIKEEAYVVENESTEIKAKADESAEGISVPPIGALLLCSFLATQKYVPSFCGSQSRNAIRPGLDSTCDYYVTRGYMPWFCKTEIENQRTSDKGRHGDIDEDDEQMETVLADFLKGGGLFPLLPTKILTRINSTGEFSENAEQILYDPSFGSLENLNNPELDIENQKRGNISGLKLVGGALATGAGLALLGNFLNKPKPNYNYNP